MTSKKTRLYGCGILGALAAVFVVAFVIGTVDFGTRSKVDPKATGVDMTAGIIPEISEQIEAVLGLDDESTLEIGGSETVTTPPLSGDETTDRQDTGTVFGDSVYTYDDLVLANVEKTLNIRKKASENADIVGRLYRGAAGAVLETDGKWIKIRSGSVEGWVLRDYVLTGQEAEAAAEKLPHQVAVIDTKTLRVRQEASSQGAILADVSKGQHYVVLGISGDWVQIRYNAKATGYVSAAYVVLEDAFATAVDSETEKARGEIYEKYEIQRAIEEARKRAKEMGRTLRSPVSLTEKEITLLAAVLDYEAGRGDKHYELQLAVANTIITRLKTGKWGDLSGVIYAKGQFTGVKSGKLQAALDRGPSESSYRAAREAAAGINNIGDYMYFCYITVAKFDTYKSYVMIEKDVFYKR